MELFNKILQSPWQFAIIIISCTYSLYILGKGINEFLEKISNIICTLLKEFAGKSKAKLAALINVILLVITASLTLLLITPNLLSQFGFLDNTSTMGYSVTLLILFISVGIWSGNFLFNHEREEQAYRNPHTKIKP